MSCHNLKYNKVEINNMLCVGCGLCAKICKFGAIQNNGGEVL
ncbi:4Fe-4S binding protein [Clostridium sp. DJ247]|nr:4Fe-4S binding protein [Clostridium sp. DJ247]